MELKDVILSTLAEMEESIPAAPKEKTLPQKQKPKEKKTILTQNIKTSTPQATKDGEVIFLTSMRERLLVLFEGFQAPNNTNIEAKIDMTLNFLEYMLANIDNRVEELKKADR